jgi:hypothetical protein
MERDLPPIRFINFDDFEALGTFPRFPENRDLTRILGSFDMETSVIVFVSHCWLRGWDGAEGWDGRPHPDNATGDKYKLCVEGIKQIMKLLAPGMKDCHLWLDYGCIDQNGDPAGELKQLDKIVEICDCIFTPMYDNDHDKWVLPSIGKNIFEDYKSPAWNGNNSSYLNRGWCRVEMFYAVNIPLVEDSGERRGKMKAGLLSHRMGGRRPHLLYGSKESAERGAPRILPPLQNSYFKAYHPENGSLTKAEDRDKIQRLVNELRPYLKTVKVEYEGELKDGKRHGKGKYVYANGAVYEGDWKDDKRHGSGNFVCANGAVYEGEYRADMRHGIGKYIHDDGAVYEGNWKDHKKDGKGKCKYANGSEYEGDWKDDMRHGKGIELTADGTTYEGDWKDDEKYDKRIER